MKPYITSVILALVLTGMSVVGISAQFGSTSPARHLAALVSLPAFPGALLMSVLGLGHGPDALPNQSDVPTFVLLTFSFWCAVIHGARVWWARCL